VVAAGRDHACTAPQRNCFIVANLPEALAPQLERLPAFVPVDGALAQYITFLHHTLVQDGGSVRCERQMLLLLLQLLQERFGEPVNVDRRIRAARAYLDRHFDRAVSLAQLAAAAHVSPRQLGELFRRQMGMTPHQYLIEKRMQAAWRLLEAGELNVQQVAERTGYSSLSAFSDRFHKHFGHSPRRIRQITK
jgi:AraC-like DNA-binding protein